MTNREYVRDPVWHVVKASAVTRGQRRLWFEAKEGTGPDCADGFRPTTSERGNLSPRPKWAKWALVRIEGGTS